MRVPRDISGENLAKKLTFSQTAYRVTISQSDHSSVIFCLTYVNIGI